jgi:hypothetical protein
MVNAVPYVKFNQSQLEKIGNTAMYLAAKIPQLTKTKLLVAHDERKFTLYSEFIESY